MKKETLVEKQDVKNKNKFYVISEKQFNADDMNTKCKYEDIKLPKRATRRSAGYDFYAPFDIVIMPGMSLKFPTGIKMSLNDNQFLAIVPRSSLGFKYKLKLDNTIGIIDADYFNNSGNEGHIWCSMTNMSSDKPVKISKGEAYGQGIIINYGLIVDDDTIKTRKGGIGSTTAD